MNQDMNTNLTRRDIIRKLTFGAISGSVLS